MVIKEDTRSLDYRSYVEPPAAETFTEFGVNCGP